jgi:glycine/D-amino acid oxidase-like deaminating enzyme
MQQRKKIIVCGGGVIGSSIAYFLSIRGANVTVIEKCSIACGASGKAGGFLAKDWNDSTALGELSRKSFDLHEELSKSFDEDIGYRKLDTLSVVVEESTKKRNQNIPKWVDGPIRTSSSLGSTKTTAQVHPELLSKAFIKASEQYGAKIIIDTVENIRWDGTTVIGVKIRGQEDILTADTVVIAMGPWTPYAAKWLPSDIRKKFPLHKIIYSIKAHSIVLRPQNPDAITAHALFVDYKGKDPEVYPRNDGTVYICGLAERAELPEDPNTIQSKQESYQWLKSFAQTISSELKDANLEKSQACFLPCSTGDGLPIIGHVPHTKGLYIATGHGCWGILNSPATGLYLAELIMDGKCSIDISAFEPKRFCS